MAAASASAGPGPLSAGAAGAVEAGAPVRGEGDDCATAAGEAVGTGAGDGDGDSATVAAGASVTGGGVGVGAGVPGACVRTVGAEVGGGGGAVVAGGGGGAVGGGVGAGVGVAVATTVTVPVMKVWISHRYGNVPARVMTIVRLWPCESTPVSKTPAAVAVCCEKSRFVQVTDSPTFTVTACGTNAELWIETAAGAACVAPPRASIAASVAPAMMRRPDLRARRARTIAGVPATSAPFEALARDASRLGVALSAAQVASCERLANELIERNTSVNLTAITAPADIATKHFLDSLTALAARRWTGRERIVDVGSGAGFPGLALRIAIAGSSCALVESVGKKARWLEEIASTLGLSRVTVHNARAEALGADAAHRGRYDVGTARAVGSLADCVEYLLPLLVPGGDAIVWKGKVDAELPAASRACQAIGGEISAIVPTSAMGVGDLLPGRHLVVVRKMRETPQRYPRSAAEIKRRPW